MARFKKQRIGTIVLCLALLNLSHEKSKKFFHFVTISL